MDRSRGRATLDAPGSKDQEPGRHPVDQKRVLLCTPYLSQHYDAGWFWLSALSQLGCCVTMWDYRAEDPPPVGWTGEETRRFDLVFVLKGQPGLVSKLPVWMTGDFVCYWPDEWGRDPEAERATGLYDRVYSNVRPAPDHAIFLPGAYHPAIHRDYGVRDSRRTVFTGTHTEYKEAVARAIRPSLIVGNGWDGLGLEAMVYPAVYLRDFAIDISAAAISVVAHRVPNVGLNRRLFESSACTFTLVDSVPGTELVFPDPKDRKLWCYSSPEEAREMVEHYLAYPGERQAAWARQRELLGKYTYLNLARRVLADSFRGEYTETNPLRA